MQFLDNNTADVIKILLIPYLTPTKTIIKKCDVSGVKKNWKPSLEESARSFVTVVPVSYVTPIFNIYVHSKIKRNKNYITTLFNKIFIFHRIFQK